MAAMEGEEAQMNARLAKKLRRAAERNWRFYLIQLKKQPFMVRLRTAWWLLFGKPI